MVKPGVAFISWRMAHSSSAAEFNTPQFRVVAGVRLPLSGPAAAVNTAPEGPQRPCSEHRNSGSAEAFGSC